MHDSILHASLRALCVAFAVILGLTLGILAITLLIGSFSSSTSDDTKLTTVYSEEILPNASGVRKVQSSTSPVILQLNIEGVIGLEQLTDSAVRQMLVESREGDFKNNRVKAILLYVNTPGGTVADADGIYRELKAYKEKYSIPIYAYVNGLCASGGVYVSLAADKILASDTSLVGSVGVIAPTFLNFTKLLEKVGVDSLTISAGKDKDAMNPLRPWKPGEEDNYKSLIDYFYGHFVDLVVKNRPELSKEKLIEDYGAKVFPASIAQEHGYIDVSNASLGETIKALAEAAGITDEHYQVIKLENKSWFKSLFMSLSNSPIFGGEVKHRLSISSEYDLLLKNEFLYLYMPN